MQKSNQYKFLQQQGFSAISDENAKTHYNALLFQPIIVGAAMLVAIITQSALLFLLFSFLLWINTLFPAANPFERIYDVTIGKLRGQAKLEPAPAPRRFMQGMAASLMFVAGLAVLFGYTLIAYVVQAFIAVAFSMLLFGQFCVGAYLYHVLKGNRHFANQTCPWSK